MKLFKVEISGFRSIKERMNIFIDGRETVILGANDHGKSNILKAITHLNDEESFVEEDLNWDLEDNRDNFPAVVYSFALSSEERTKILEDWEFRFASHSPIEADEQKSDTADGEVFDSVDNASNDYSFPLKTPSMGQVPINLEIVRKGVGQRQSWRVPDVDTRDGLLDDSLEDFLYDNRPRVELITPLSVLNDSVGREEIGQIENEFMQGIFFTANLDPMDSSNRFDQNDRTTMRLREASGLLDAELRESWAQGRDGELHFELDHREGRIELLMQDPSVTGTYVRASRRSSGFTHFFFDQHDIACPQQEIRCRAVYLAFRRARSFPSRNRSKRPDAGSGNTFEQ